MQSLQLTLRRRYLPQELVDRSIGQFAVNESEFLQMEGKLICSRDLYQPSTAVVLDAVLFQNDRFYFPLAQVGGFQNQGQRIVLKAVIHQI